MNQEAAHFSLDLCGFHLIFLDACYRPDGMEYAPGEFEWDASEIPEGERGWLAADLASTDRPSVIFAHQRLDIPADDRYRVQSAAAVREILQASGKVRLVMRAIATRTRADIEGIPFVTLRAMVLGEGLENNAAAVLNARRPRLLRPRVRRTGELALTGGCGDAGRRPRRLLPLFLAGLERDLDQVRQGSHERQGVVRGVDREMRRRKLSEGGFHGRHEEGDEVLAPAGVRRRPWVRDHEEDEADTSGR